MTQPGALGKTVRSFDEIGNKLEPIEVSPDIRIITFVSDEVSSVCPVTGQPDMYEVSIDLAPNPENPRSIESKSLKLYFTSLRDKGVFAENLSAEIANKIWNDISPDGVSVEVKQKSRGGISIVARTVLPHPRWLSSPIHLHLHREEDPAGV